MLANAWHSAPVSAPLRGSVNIHKPFPMFISGELQWIEGGHAKEKSNTELGVMPLWGAISICFHVVIGNTSQ